MSVFVGVFALLLIVERLFAQRVTRKRGYIANLGIFLIDSVVTRLLLVVGGVAAASWAAVNNIGLFHFVNVPVWLSVGIAFVLLDFAVWLQHVATHKIPILWRLHEVHHADEHVDVTTGLRFHPIEIALSLVFKSAVIVALGAPVLAVIVFEVVLNAGAMFSHSNIRLPARVDRVLRMFTVTPDMHRVHHSTDHGEANSNYGFFLPWWDHLFRTYRAQPRDGHEAMDLGVEGAPTGRYLQTLLVRPFVPRAPTTPAR